MSAVCVGAIMKAERPYVIEWVAWHRLLGFELVIADNGGDDGQTELLAALAEHGFITRIDVRRFRHRPQRRVYGLLFRWARQKGFDSIGFLDADEFFEPMVLASHLDGIGAELVTRLFQETSAAALAFNYILFGDSHLVSPGPEPVMERFVMAAHKDFNSGVKSFCHVERCQRLFSTRFGRRYFMDAHHPPLLLKHLSHDGAPFRPAGALTAVTQETSWRHARVRHYAVKTWTEYQRGKMRRGDVAKARSEYGERTFAAYNRNDAYAPLPPAALARLKEEMAQIEKAIAGIPKCPLPVLPWYAREELHKRWLSRPYPLGYLGSVLARWRRAITKLLPLRFRPRVA
jgi:glycosyltransferase involved in cell wall biosynthesis